MRHTMCRGHHLSAESIDPDLQTSRSLQICSTESLENLTELVISLWNVFPEELKLL